MHAADIDFGKVQRRRESDRHLVLDQALRLCANFNFGCGLKRGAGLLAPPGPTPQPWPTEAPLDETAICHST